MSAISLYQNPVSDHKTEEELIQSKIDELTIAINDIKFIMQSQTIKHQNQMENNHRSQQYRFRHPRRDHRTKNNVFTDTHKNSASQVLANADTGSTGNFISLNDAHAILDVKTTTKPITVMLPDGSKAVSTHVGILNWPSLPIAARHVDIFPNWYGSLLSSGNLGDHGLMALYSDKSVTISNKNGDTIMMATDVQRQSSGSLIFPPTTPLSHLQAPTQCMPAQLSQKRKAHKNRSLPIITHAWAPLRFQRL